jgi:hypothetical protein
VDDGVPGLSEYQRTFRVWNVSFVFLFFSHVVWFSYKAFMD